MSTEHELPISYVKQFTPLVVGDVYYNKYLKLELAMDQQEVDAFNSGVDHFNTYFLISFVARPNTGKQPVGDDVTIYVSDKINIDQPKLAGDVDWGIDSMLNHIVSWKLNHAALLTKFKEQGANMNEFTFENTEDATHLMIFSNYDGLIEFNNDRNKSFLNSSGFWMAANLGVNRKLGSNITKIELSRPIGERKEDHTIDGVTTYALRYKLDLLTEEATHCYKKCPTFYRLTLGKYAAVLKDNSVWVTSDCTTNEELNGPEFFALDADQDNHKEDAHHIAIQIEKLGNQPKNHIDLAISAGAVDDIVISPDEKSGLAYCDIDKDGKMTPAFTQAMADDFEMPEVGSHVEIFDAPSGSYVKCEIICHHKKALFIAVEGWDAAVSVADDSLFRPIDNRTDEEKSIDDIVNHYKSGGTDESMIDAIKADKITGVKWSL